MIITVLLMNIIYFIITTGNYGKNATNSLL